MAYVSCIATRFASEANCRSRSPEYYSSSITVNRDGETIANYRKSFLYYTDETWALEGPDGFYDGEIEDLGNVAMGICKWPTKSFEREFLVVYRSLIELTFICNRHGFEVRIKTLIPSSRELTLSQVPTSSRLLGVLGSLHTTFSTDRLILL